MPSLGLSTPQVKIAGTALSQARLDDVVDIRVLQDVQASSMATVRFHDPAFELLDGSLVSIGNELEISFPTAPGTDVVVFKGVVSAVGAEQGAGERHELVVTAYDYGQELAHTVEPATYLNMTVGDIVTKIAQARGLTATVSDATLQLDYFMKLDSDRATLDHLASLCGAEWRMTAKKLTFGKRSIAAAVELTWGESLRRISARFTGAMRATTVTVRGWDSATQAAVVGTATRSSVTSATTGHDLTLGTTRARQASALGGEMAVTDRPVASAADATALAKAIAGDLASSELRIKGEAEGEPKISAGGTVTIVGAGTQMGGTFVVSRVEHAFGPNGLVSRFEAGRLGSGGVADRLVGAERSQQQLRRMLAIGTVTNTADPEKAGRVKVKLPTVSDQGESTWARVVTLGAGAARGIEFMPAVGDEVVLGYLGADTAFPVVFGSLWSKKNAPPIPEPAGSDGVITERTITAASGAKLSFLEGDTSKSATKLIHAEPGTSVVLDKDGIKITAKTDTKVVISVGDASVQLESDGTISIKGGTLTIKAEQNLTLQGQKVTIKGSNGVSLDGGGAKVDLSPGGAKVESSAITEIKGAMVKLN